MSLLKRDRKARSGRSVGSSPTPTFSKVWVPSTIYDKVKPILKGDKGMSDLVVCEKLMRAMILLVDYDIVINMSQEDRQCNINMVGYHVCYFLHL